VFHGKKNQDFMDFASFKKIFAAGSVEISPTAGGFLCHALRLPETVL
jgi:hypothetical protein